MALKLSMGHLAAVQKKLQSVQARAEGIKKKGDRIVGALVDTGIIAGTAFVAGTIQGRTGGVMLPGNVSLELAGGVLMHGLGFMGIGGHHLHSAGNGLLAVHAATLGRGQGKLMLDKKNKELLAAGQPPVGGGVHLLSDPRAKGKKDTLPASKETVVSGSR